MTEPGLLLCVGVITNAPLSMLVIPLSGTNIERKYKFKDIKCEIATPAKQDRNDTIFPNCLCEEFRVLGTTKQSHYNYA